MSNSNEHDTLAGSDRINIDWNDWVYYDDTSPSGLRWCNDRYAGEYMSVKVAAKDGVAGSKSTKNWSLSVRIDGERVRMLCHRIIWELFNSKIPEGLVIDHIDRNPFNNSIDNLRLVEQKINARNSTKYKRNKTGITGVSLIKDRHGYTYYVAHWYELDGKHKVKYFSTNKYGEKSLYLAHKHREDQITRLNSEGAGYTDTHGE